MELATLLLCRTVLKNLTLKVGADDFSEVAPLVLSALSQIDEAIRVATTDPWPGMATPLTVPPSPVEGVEGD